MFENQACFIFYSPVTAAHMVAPANWPGEGGGGGGGFSPPGVFPPQPQEGERGKSAKPPPPFQHRGVQEADPV